MKEDPSEKIEWDLEDLKKAIKDSAADYDLTIEKMKEVDSEDGDYK